MFSYVVQILSLLRFGCEAISEVAEASSWRNGHFIWVLDMTY